MIRSKLLGTGFHTYQLIYNACSKNVQKDGHGLCTQSSSKELKIATIDDVKNAKEKNILIIDVREPAELKETGMIPGSLNIPYSKILSTTFFSSSPDKKIATYEDVKNVNDKTIIIDVREPNELKETGILPYSVNIPLGQIGDAFALPEDDFEHKYGFRKSNSDLAMIFSCQAGIRSEKAMNIVEKLGYLNVRNYKGGWNDWKKMLKL